jgi:hypothetical protein
LLRRLLVMLMIWQAAAPCCHAHVDATAFHHPLSLCERLQLTLHLQARHTVPDHSDSHEQPWHTHFGLPAESVPATDVSIESPVEEVQIELLPALQSVGWILSHAPLTASRTRSNLGGGFYSAFAAALPLPMRHKVALL